MKKLTIVAALAMAVAVLAVPGTAGAIWTDGGAHIQSNVQVHGEGTVGFASESGNIHCTDVTNVAQLTSGQTTGHVNQFNVPQPELKCHTEGPPGHCTVTSVQPTNLPWVAHTNNTNGINVTGILIDLDLHGFLCPDLQLHLNNAMDFVELFGEQNGATGHSAADAIEITGTVTSTPIGTVNATGTVTATAGQQDRYGWT